MELKNTKLKGGEYTIVKTLGQGGFGITYLAKMKTLVKGNIGEMEVESDVVLKEYFLEKDCRRADDGKTVLIKEDENAQERQRMQDEFNHFRDYFKREALNLTEMDHPNIVKVVSLIEDENNTSYYVMKYLKGGNLEELVHSQPQGRLPEVKVKKFGKQIAEALDYMHQRKACHYDIKPNNIMLDDQGDAVLIDFGFTMMVRKGEKQKTKLVNVSKGFSPMEQNTISGFYPLADIYSFGATLYYLLTGEVPGEAEFNLKNMIGERPDYVSEDMWSVITNCMQPIPENRPQSIKQVIGMFRNKTDVISDVVTNDSKCKKGINHKNMWGGLIFIVTMVLGFVLSYFVINRGKMDKDKPVEVLQMESQLSNTGNEKMALENIDDVLGVISDGLVPVRNTEGKCGFVDIERNVKIPFVYKDAHSFSEGLVAVKNEKNEWGYVDKSGNTVIGFKNWESVGDFYYNRSVVKTRDGYGIINSRGEYVSTPTESWVPYGNYSDGMLRIAKKGNDGKMRIGFKDINGDEIIPCNYYYASDFSCGLAVVMLEVKDFTSSYGYINKKGEISLGPFVGRADSFFNDVALVYSDDGLYRFIDSSGNVKLVIDNELSCIGHFSDDLVHCEQMESLENVYIDINGIVKLRLKSKDEYSFNHDSYDDFHNGLARVIRDGLWGYINKKGETIIDCIYNKASDFNGDYALVEKSGKHYLIDKNGNNVFN